jgi:hypothetical protein
MKPSESTPRNPGNIIEGNRGHGSLPPTCVSAHLAESYGTEQAAPRAIPQARVQAPATYRSRHGDGRGQSADWPLNTFPMTADACWSLDASHGA